MSNRTEAAVHHDTALINIRKLAALDIALHGPVVILGEVCLTVFGSAALGSWLVYKGFFVERLSLWQNLLGYYELFIALNYVPLLLYAIKIVRRRSAQEEVAFELDHRAYYGRKYTLQSLLVALPLVVPILAIYQEWQKRGDKEERNV